MRRPGLLTLTVIIISCLFSGCSSEAQMFLSNIKHSAPEVDYLDWYRDINDSGSYNYTNSIELDVWFTEPIEDQDWSCFTYDVYYEGNIIRSDLGVSVGENYLECYFDIYYGGAVLTDGWYLAPGKYEIKLKDNNSEEIASSSCVVTANAGEVLSQMITDYVYDDYENGAVSIRISFNDDITPYTHTGFFITFSIDGVPQDLTADQYSIEIADTYIIVNYYPSEDYSGEAEISLYCGNGTLVCTTNAEQLN